MDQPYNEVFTIPFQKNHISRDILSGRILPFHGHAGTGNLCNRTLFYQPYTPPVISRNGPEEVLKIEEKTTDAKSLDNLEGKGPTVGNTGFQPIPISEVDLRKKIEESENSKKRKSDASFSDQSESAPKSSKMEGQGAQTSDDSPQPCCSKTLQEKSESPENHSDTSSDSDVDNLNDLFWILDK